MNKNRIGKDSEGFQLTTTVESVLAQRFSEVWIIGELGEDMVEALKRVVRNKMLEGVKRLKLVFYLSGPEDLNYLNLLRPVLLENVSMSIVVEERSVKSLLDDVRIIKDEVNVIMGKTAPAELVKAVELSRDRLKVVGIHD